jgi:uridylate kinase
MLSLSNHEDALMPTAPKFRRILLKVSGEALMGSGSFGVDIDVIDRIARDVKEAHGAGTQICMVVGGGNIFRGLAGSAKGIDRSTADYMGMLATVMNALALQAGLERVGLACRVQSAIAMNNVCEPYIRRRAARHMEKGRVVIFAAGTGNPFFTTDTAAALRAAEMSCDALLKATQVDGVYSADPKKVPDAKRYDSLSYHEVLAQNLQVMDAAAISLSRENRIPILVFSLAEPGGLAKVLKGEGRATIIEEK